MVDFLVSLPYVDDHENAASFPIRNRIARAPRTVLITNTSASEWRDYDTTYSIPNAANTVVITDNELCTVGSSGQPPTNVYVEFQLSSPTGPITLQEEIALTFTCP